MIKSRNVREAESLLKALLDRLAPHKPQTSNPDELKEWKTDRANWEASVEQLVWHLVQAAGEEGRAVVR